VIWLTQDGQHGLVAAIKDAGTGLKWTSNGSYAQINATNNEPLPSSTPSTPYAQYYSGYKNQGIIEGVTEYNSTTYPAAYAAANFSYTDSTTNITYTDWWMPSSSELSLIYAARGVIDAVATAHNGDSLRRRFYWSSREEDSNGAWFLDVSSGNQYVNNKDDSYAVRCVRAF
jgi:hypothetical protein